MLSNDFEMMLKAYSSSGNGIPQYARQFYKSFIEEDNEGDTISYSISDIIVNKKDENEERGKVVPKYE